MAIILWFVAVILNLNQNVQNTSIVQAGFSVTLGLANLLFVLGIIIVALATILRRESYGIKSVLWKIIIMAILVNFALVIAAPIVGFANGLTMYFVNALPGGTNSTSGGTNSTSSITGFTNLANGIAGVFQPQQLVTPENSPSTLQTQIQNTVSNTFGSLFAGILGLLLSTVMLVMMCIALIVLLVMLLIRYVYITILFILFCTISLP